MMDRRIYLPEGKGKELMNRMSISRSKMDNALKGYRESYISKEDCEMIRRVAKEEFGGMYLVKISGSELRLTCRFADQLFKGVNEDYMVISKALEMLSKMAINQRAKFVKT